MGIFTDARDEDIEAISQIVTVSLSFYQSECAKRGSPFDFEVKPNSDFGAISDLGTRVLHEFHDPTALQRVAALVVVCNSSRPFSISQKGKLFLNVDARKEFLSRFTCLLVQAALSTMSMQRGGQDYSLRWNGFPDAYFCEQFLVYLQWTESFVVVPGGDRNSRQFKAAMEAFDRILAHLVLGCALALVSCVSEDDAASTQATRLLSES
jgi:hypothetical protein